ncbi:MAG: holo-ACP synthase [Ramlibacter sp.]
MQDMAETMSSDLPAGMRLGFDLVRVSHVAQSLEQFGAAFESRLFTPHERAYAHSGTGVAIERLAARFAAKEAVIKALGLSNAGVSWRDIEVRKQDDGDCSVRLHGLAADIAASRGVSYVLLSLSHDGDYAGAVATVIFCNKNQQRS